jgi:lysophospholipase L1-like esterase
MQSGGITNLAVLNQAAGGNAVLNGGLGPTLLSRYKRDGLNRPAVKYVMIFEGTNDIGSSSGTAVGDQLINAYKTIIADARKLGYKTIGATITPFCGSGQSYCQGSRDSVRQKVNTWILGAGNFDYVVDFDKILRSSSTTNQLDAKYNSGDGLHPNVAGYQAIANAFPLDILK